MGPPVTVRGRRGTRASPTLVIPVPGGRGRRGAVAIVVVSAAAVGGAVEVPVVPSLSRIPVSSPERRGWGWRRGRGFRVVGGGGGRRVGVGVVFAISGSVEGFNGHVHHFGHR